MAWLPVRFELPDDPAVISIANDTGLDQDSVVGKLIRLWTWSNAQSRDGHAQGVTHSWVDRHVRHEGFAVAMEKAGWLAFENGNMTIPNWDNWNSASAKKRLGAAKRQASKRIRDVTPPSRKIRDNSVTREEKRREEKKTPLPPKGEPWAADSVLNTFRFKAAWAEWVKYRGKAKLKPSTVERQIPKLEKMGHDDAIRAIEQSIEQGWTGLFDPNGQAGTGGGSRLGRIEAKPGKYDHLPGGKDYVAPKR